MFVRRCCMVHQTRTLVTNHIVSFSPVTSTSASTTTMRPFSSSSLARPGRLLRIQVTISGLPCQSRVHGVEGTGPWGGRSGTGTTAIPDSMMISAVGASWMVATFDWFVLGSNCLRKRAHWLPKVGSRVKNVWTAGSVARRSNASQSIGSVCKGPIGVCN
ncbi:hypothetical protein T439DRAFT_177440 [Meredithblackwellia eburnea MCA 4105]